MNTRADPAKAGRCPICRAATERRWRPFCSRRCADIDLGRWLTGAYALPSEDDRPAQSVEETGGQD